MNFDPPCSLIDRGDYAFVSRREPLVSAASLSCVDERVGQFTTAAGRSGRNNWRSAFASSQSGSQAARPEPPAAPIDRCDQMHTGERIGTFGQLEASRKIIGRVDEVIGGAGYLGRILGWWNGGASGAGFPAGQESRLLAPPLVALGPVRVYRGGMGRGHAIGLGDVCPGRDGRERRSPRAGRERNCRVPT